jgi:hypothetical protein
MLLAQIIVCCGDIIVPNFVSNRSIYRFFHCLGPPPRLDKRNQPSQNEILQQVETHNESRGKPIVSRAVIGFAFTDLLEPEARIKGAGGDIFGVNFEKQPIDPMGGQSGQMRRQKMCADPVAAPFRGDGEGQNFRLVRDEAGQNEGCKLLLLGLDSAIGKSLRGEKKLFKISFLPRMCKARRMNGRAFGTPLDADGADKGRNRFGQPTDHVAFTGAALKTVSLLAA